MNSTLSHAQGLRVTTTGIAFFLSMVLTGWIEFRNNLMDIHLTLSMFLVSIAVASVAHLLSLLVKGDNETSCPAPHILGAIAALITSGVFGLIFDAFVGKR